MRVLNRFRQKLSVVLMASMVATMAVPPVTGLADETAHPVWKLEDGGWRLYKKDGSGYYKNKVKLNAGKWYAFDDEGWMFSNEQLMSPDDDEKFAGLQYYAFADGHLMTQGWVRLNSDGEMYDNYGDPNADDMFWYYYKPSQNYSEGPGRMIYDTFTTTNNKMYALDAGGIMLSREWAYEEDGHVKTLADYSDGQYDFSYFQFEGQAAQDKWLPIGDFWYHFNGDGVADEAIPVASDSDADDPTGIFIPSDDIKPSLASDSGWDGVYHAPGRVIESIDLTEKQSEYELALGKSLTLSFEAILASDSNAKDDGFKASYHDIWASMNKSGKIEKINFNKTNKGKYMITITYTQKMPVEETIQFYIDDRAASDPITITPVLEESSAQEESLKNVLDSVENLAPTQLQKQLATTYSAATTPEQKQNLQSVLLKSDNFDKISESYAMQMKIVETTSVSDDAAKQLNGDVKVAGGALNTEEEESVVTLNVGTTETPTLTNDTYKAKMAFDITLDINDTPVNELTVPVKITMPVPASFATGSFDLIHIHGDAETKVPYTLKTVDGITYMTFMADRFSTFVFAKTDSNNNNNGNGSGGSGGSGGGSGSSSSSAGIVTTDAKRGKVNSVTGIITGSGAGYSKWESVTAQNGAVTWKLQYADGTYAAGSMKTKADGTAYEQVAWELINGAWYPFGADGFAKTGFVYDADLGGYFYVDINAGMKTGWTLIDGKWYYLNPTADGKLGMMLTDTTVGGYRVGSDGVWVE